MKKITALLLLVLAACADNLPTGTTVGTPTTPVAVTYSASTIRGLVCSTPGATFGPSEQRVWIDTTITPLQEGMRYPPHTEFIFLRNNATGKFISGQKVEWVSRSPEIFNHKSVPQGSGTVLGTGWVVGTVQYAGQAYSDSIPTKVVLNPLAECF